MLQVQMSPVLSEHGSAEPFCFLERRHTLTVCTLGRYQPSLTAFTLLGAPRLIRAPRPLVTGTPLGAEDLSDLKAHPFFAGIDWDTLRSGPAPPFLPPTPPGSGDEEGLDWELSSLVRDAAEGPRRSPSQPAGSDG
jgi:hypothetical protein